MLNRREFLRKSALGGGLLVSGGFSFDALASGGATQLTILHTNDVHSRLDPFPMDGGKWQGQGGVAARASLIRKIRATEEHVILLDAGDIFQGTPYFNLYKGEPEIKAMTMMGYDAATMGNHDFDAGMDGFAQQLPHAKFPILVANYDFGETILEGKVAPYTVLKRGPLKIGIFGLGIQLWGLVPPDAFGKTKYLDPLPIAREMGNRLKRKMGCDLVICLSHLGYQYDSFKVSDCIVARESEDIDLIIGGHTHTFLDEPALIKNKVGKEVIVNQVGWGGTRLGVLKFVFDSKKSTKISKAHTVIPIKETIG